MTDGYGARLFDQHANMLEASGITPDHARERGYVSVDTKKRLEGLKVVKPGRSIPGLLIPQLRKDGSTWGWQYRPDEPRTNGDGKPPGCGVGAAQMARAARLRWPTGTTSHSMGAESSSRSTRTS